MLLNVVILVILAIPANAETIVSNLDFFNTQPKQQYAIQSKKTDGGNIVGLICGVGGCNMTKAQNRGVLSTDVVIKVQTNQMINDNKQTQIVTDVPVVKGLGGNSYNHNANQNRYYGYDIGKGIQDIIHVKNKLASALGLPQIQLEVRPLYVQNPQNHPMHNNWHHYNQNRPHGHYGHNYPHGGNQHGWNHHQQRPCCRERGWYYPTPTSTSSPRHAGSEIDDKLGFN